MRTIKGQKIITVIYILIVLMALGGIYKTIEGFQIEYESLSMEVSQLEIQKQELIEVKELLERTITQNNREKEALTLQLEDLKTENEQLRTIRAKLTAYSPLDNVDGQQAEGNPSRTSIGRQVSRGIVAADPRKLPYGTKLEIPDWGVVEVGDTGGALRNDNKNIRIDLFHSTYPEAMRFGVQDKKVKILEWGDKN